MTDFRPDPKLPGFREDLLLQALKAAAFPLTAILLAVFLLLPVSPVRAANTDSSEDDGFAWSIRPGVSGIYWNPKGIAPYELRSYGRGFLLLETNLAHPLSALGESFDIVDIPVLRLESNFGSYAIDTVSSSGIQEDTGNPYFSLDVEAVFFRFLAVRWQTERQVAHFSYPGGFFTGSDGDISYETLSPRIDRTQRDLAVGIIGTPTGELESAEIEIGYLNALRRPPLSLSVDGPTAIPSFYLPEFRFNGVYMLSRTDPIPEIWPLYTQVGVGFATGKAVTSVGSDLYRILPSGENDATFKLLEFDARFALERPVYRGNQAGLALSVVYSVLSGKYETNDGKTYGISNLDVHLSLSLYAVFRVL